MAVEIRLDQARNGEQNYLTIRDGKRGVVRLNSDEAHDLADLLRVLQTDRGAR